MTKKIESKDLIDRKTASRLLNTSVRTIDRYRQKGMLSTAVIDNKIYLNKEEIEDFMNRQSRQEESTFVSMDNRVDTDDSEVDTRSTKPSHEKKDPINRHDHELDLVDYYKQMYEEIARELREKQAKLEGANYRVGQLESQLRWTVPLIEYQQETRKLLNDGEHYKKMAAEREEAVKKLRKNFYIERMNKRIYLAIVLGLIVLQPLWLILAK